ncbi:MAG TPA: hypothetical protein DEO95_02290 [Ruminococcaceae bacterium]|nr:hypothetical protein [Oscillospiraceae bacterium]
MRKKTIAALTAVVMVITFMPKPSFAMSDRPIKDEEGVVQENMMELDVEGVAEIVESSTDALDLLTNVDKEDDEFKIEGKESDVIIPENGDGKIVMDGNGGDRFSMSLPKQICSMNGKIAGEGTVVYDNDISNVAVAVQGVQEKQGDIVVDGFRSLMIIENPDAPHEYQFEFNLPDGCKLVQDGNYINIVNENNIITDENGEQFYEIIGSINPAWARDSNGDSVNSYYKLNGNIITQVVEFDAYSAFPIVADPTATGKPKSKYVSTKSIGCNISHSVIGVGSFVAGSGFKFLTASAKKKVVTAVAAKLGSKVIPIVSWSSWAVTGYAALASGAGYDHTKITGSYEVWTYYKKQGGQWVQGYQYRNGKMKCKLVK